MLQGDLATAKQALTESLEIDRRLQRIPNMAYSLYFLGELALIQNDLPGAQRHHQESLDLRTQLGEKGTAAESRAALAVLALEQKQTAEAESLAREAAVVFEEQRAANNEAMARSTVALAMLAQGKRDTARREIEHARALVRNTQNVDAKMSVALASAQIGAVGAAPAAIRELESLLSEAVKRGIPRFAFEARRALADIEGSSNAGIARRASLQRDAKERGFLLYSR
jgi:tetratricopeptide (TPR) repeat protein